MEKHVKKYTPHIANIRFWSVNIHFPNKCKRAARRTYRLAAPCPKCARAQRVHPPEP